MHSIPKILPIWNNVGLRDVCHIRGYQFDPWLLPDHGGAGIDAFVTEDGNMECISLKSEVDTLHFRSTRCCLPFLPPNNVTTLFDPCLTKLKDLEEKQAKFCTRLECLRVHMKRPGELKKNVCKLIDELPKIIAEDKSDHVLVHPSILELLKLFPEDFPVSKHNYRYSGGCLSYCPSSFTNSNSVKGLLLHPSGKKFNKVVISSIKEGSTEGKAFEFNQEEVRKKLKGKTIYQIEHQFLSAQTFCAVRQNNIIRVLELTSDEDEHINLTQVQCYETSDRASYVKFSPYISGEYAVITEKGQFVLKTVESDSICKDQNPLSHNAGVANDWWTFYFGSHPRALAYADSSSLSLMDLRSKKAKTINLFSTPCPFVLPAEYISMSCPLKQDTFQHLIGTTHHLLIFDERYPGQPLMSWNHMLKTSPFYCDMANVYENSDLSLVTMLLASQISQEVSVFSVSKKPGQLQPFSLCPPWLLSQPKDFVQSLQLHGIFMPDSLKSRTSMPLTGVSIVPHQNYQGFSAFQLTSLGDVFYQDYRTSNDAEKSSKEKTFKVGPGCVLTSSDEILSEAQCWLDIATVEEHIDKEENLQRVDLSEKISDILKPRLGSKNCAICSNLMTFDIKKAKDKILCESCGLESVSSKYLVETKEKGGVLAGPLPTSKSFSEKVNISTILPKVLKLDSFTDDFSKKLLAEWNKEKDDPIPSTSHEANNKSVFTIPETSVLPPDQKSVPKIPSYIDNETHSSIDRQQFSFVSKSDDEDIMLPPSQEPRISVGETLRTPVRKKCSAKKKLLVTGF